jgi:hypothetical protein
VSASPKSSIQLRKPRPTAKFHPDYPPSALKIRVGHSKVNAPDLHPLPLPLLMWLQTPAASRRGGEVVDNGSGVWEWTWGERGK